MDTMIERPGTLARMSSARALHLSDSLALLGGMARRLDHFACGLTGHDELLRFEPKRLSLQCTRCGHQTPGWEIRSSHPRRLLPARARHVTRAAKAPDALVSAAL
jgi:hypothetical protein